MLLAGAAIYVGAGCGGSLSGGTGGTGGVASGTAGTNSPPPTGIAATSGTVGTGGTGGSPYEGTTTWGDVTVQVAPTNLAPGMFELIVVDPTTPDARRTFSYPLATRFSPSNDGAYLTVRYTCGGPAAVDQVAVLSCDAGGIAGGTNTPGCIGVTFDQRGPMGNFMDTDGTSCRVTAGSASFHIPPPGSAPPTDASAPDAASGSFLLDCIRPDATHLSLMARFVIPFDTRVLLCIN